MTYGAPWQDSGMVLALPAGRPATQRQSPGGRTFATRVMEEEPAVEDVMAGTDYLMQLHIEHNQYEYCIMVRLVVAIVRYRKDHVRQMGTSVPTCPCRGKVEYLAKASVS